MLTIKTNIFSRSGQAALPTGKYNVVYSRMMGLKRLENQQGSTELNLPPLHYQKIEMCQTEPCLTYALGWNYTNWVVNWADLVCGFREDGPHYRLY